MCHDILLTVACTVANFALLRHGLDLPMEVHVNNITVVFLLTAIKTSRSDSVELR